MLVREHLREAALGLLPGEGLYGLVGSLGFALHLEQPVEVRGLRRADLWGLQDRVLNRFIAASGPFSITASTASAARGTASLTAESMRPST